MAHVGQKIAFGICGRLRRLLGVLEIVIETVHLILLPVVHADQALMLVEKLFEISCQLAVLLSEAFEGETGIG